MRGAAGVDIRTGARVRADVVPQPVPASATSVAQQR